MNYVGIIVNLKRNGTELLSVRKFQDYSEAVSSTNKLANEYQGKYEGVVNLVVDEEYSQRKFHSNFVQGLVQKVLDEL